MPFPIVHRSLYKINPLEQVVCQIKFPPLLKIDHEIPYVLQEAIRQVFPQFSDQQSIQTSVSNVAGAFQMNVALGTGQIPGPRNFAFTTEDGNTKISLARDFLAMETSRYTRWEEFKNFLDEPWSQVCSIYRPTYAARIGLRYINVIRRSLVNLGSAEWSELINPSVIGVLSESKLRESVTGIESVVNINLPDSKSAVRLACRTVEHVPSQEQCLMIDADFSVSARSEISDVNSQLEYFHLQSTNLFRWCITDKLHMAMGPQQL